MMDEQIKIVWFENGNIFIKNNYDEVLGLPLEVFPALKEASTSQREKFYIWGDAKSIRWEELDEDIHISHFHEPETVNYDNDVNVLLTRYPWIDMKALADYIGIHWTMLARFRYGVWNPTEEMMDDIRNSIVKMGKEMTLAAV